VWCLYSGVCWLGWWYEVVTQVGLAGRVAVIGRMQYFAICLCFGRMLQSSLTGSKKHKQFPCLSSHNLAQLLEGAPLTYLGGGSDDVALFGGP
jgi:hypothetical protein